MPRWIVLGVAVGLVSGTVAAVFFYLLELASFLTFDLLAGTPLPRPEGEKIVSWAGGESPRRWLFFLLPALGGLVSGWLVYRFAPEAEGHGADAMIDAFHNREGLIRARVPLLKAVATIITLATGGSAGREGPIAQIGGGIGSSLANLLGLSTRDRRILLLAGTGGGLGAIFRAPLGGALTALEVIYRRDLESEALIPTVISSITAYTLFRYLIRAISGVEGVIFTIPPLSFSDPRELIFYVILGLICVPLGILYIRLFYFTRDRVFRPMKLPPHFKPMLGGLAVGLIGLFLPEVYGAGWGQIQNALLGRTDLLPIKIMALIIVFKILATCFTIGSGGSGGVFGPTLFIGAMIGGVSGHLSHHLFPGIVTDGRAFILVGMASFFAGVAHAPLGALLMVTEMTGGYELIAPLLLVSAIAIMFNRRYSIYTKQAETRFDSPAHAGDLTVNVLEKMKVGDFMLAREKCPRIRAEAPLAEVQYRLVQDDAEALPVVAASGAILGIVSLESARPILFEEDAAQFLIAQDLAEPAELLRPDHSLYHALQAFMKHPLPALAVVDPQDHKKILGLLRHQDLIRAYRHEIEKTKK